jgi:ubiquinone/menaquinone biosynthesis C-methylase UbiE
MRGVEQIPWVYDLLVGLFERTGLGRWRRWHAEGASGRTLDLGCGTGRSLPLYPASARPFALDPEIRLLLRARKRAPLVPFVLARAEALPFPRGAFDTAAVSLVFCSVADPPKGLAEIRRVLAPGGTLRMLEHVRPDGLGGRLADLIQPSWTFVAGGCHPNRRTEEAVAAAGFALEPGKRRISSTLRRFVARPVVSA